MVVRVNRGREATSAAETSGIGAAIGAASVARAAAVTTAEVSGGISINIGISICSLRNVAMDGGVSE